MQFVSKTNEHHDHTRIQTDNKDIWKMRACH